MKPKTKKIDYSKYIKEQLILHISILDKAMESVFMEKILLESSLRSHKRWINLPWYKKIFREFIDFTPTKEELEKTKEEMDRGHND